MPSPWPSQDLISRVTMFNRSPLLLVLVVRKIVKRKVTIIFLYKNIIVNFVVVLKSVKVWSNFRVVLI